MSQTWKIKDLVLENKVVLAPLAGISNPAFRITLKNYHPGLMYTEMTSDKALIYKNKKTWKMMEVKPEEKPVALQLFGNDPMEMGKAAKIVSENSLCDVIDVNMGCPMPKVVRQGSGSGLLRTPEIAKQIIQEIKENTELPVTAKIRIGWDKQSINAIEMAKILEEAGVDALAVHGRTRSEYYEGSANWDIIKEVKDRVKIPVIGNGDIKTPEEAKEKMEYAGVDAVMIGRGMLGNPWLIQQTVDYLEKGTYEKEVSLATRFEACLAQARALVSDYGEEKGMKMMRSHACWYVTGLSHSNQVKAIVSKVKRYQDLEDTLKNYKIALEESDYSFLNK